MVQEIKIRKMQKGRGRIVLFEDLTERLRIEREIRSARFRAEESERRRIARELHDEVGEVLTGLHLALDRMVTKGSESESGAPVEALLDQLMSRVKNLSLDLRPPVLDDMGLLPALDSLVERFRVQTGIPVELKQTAMSSRFREDVEIAAYRVVQEALTNVARHAQAKHVTVRAWTSSGMLNLQVEDDGKGIGEKRSDETSAQRYKGGGSGLNGMRQRVALLGGTVQIEPAEVTGTRVSVELPVTAGVSAVS